MKKPPSYQYTILTPAKPEAGALLTGDANIKFQLAWRQLHVHAWVCRSFMSRRSDYFSAMLGSNFQEGSTASGDILEIQVADVQPEVLYAALRWVYTDRVDADMPAEQLLQVNHLHFPACC